VPRFQAVFWARTGSVKAAASRPTQIDDELPSIVDRQKAEQIPFSL
jgi:hypothetical protein